eukprot:TRINITY_DN26149_c0_g1_i1.p1 TRINITY_DN26149_c0_g1~~TRINITY_DN26149_c0_g1_i1.p1  ORF type:complete len:149 (+),score=22.73 TRINITY_DN26149_c0_g1_i1:189-635(+)
MRNVRALNAQRFPVGTPVAKTTRKFIWAALAEEPGSVYLQRGFRQYGNPHEETMNAMTILEEKTLDRDLNTERICECDCAACKQRWRHSVHNCSRDCISRPFNPEILELKERNLACMCTCAYCTSGVLNANHKQHQCVTKCYERQPKV